MILHIQSFYVVLGTTFLLTFNCRDKVFFRLKFVKSE